MKWAKQQPKDGDLILVCSHRNRDKYHWYMFGVEEAPRAIQFARPDGTIVQSRWMCICDSCERSYPGDPQSAIRGERIWTGDAPVIPDFSN